MSSAGISAVTDFFFQLKIVPVLKYFKHRQNFLSKVFVLGDPNFVSYKKYYSFNK